MSDLGLEIWQQRAERVKGVIVTPDNREAIDAWIGDTTFDGKADLVDGDAVVLTGNGAYADGTPRPGQFTRVAADQIDYLYRRNEEGKDDTAWYSELDTIKQAVVTLEENLKDPTYVPPDPPKG